MEIANITEKSSEIFLFSRSFNWVITYRNFNNFIFCPWWAMFCLFPINVSLSGYSFGLEIWKQHSIFTYIQDLACFINFTTTIWTKQTFANTSISKLLVTIFNNLMNKHNQIQFLFLNEFSENSNFKCDNFFLPSSSHSYALCSWTGQYESYSKPSSNIFVCL